MLKKFFGFLFIVLFSCPLLAQEQRPEVRGVWLSREVVIQGRTSMRDAFRQLKDAGFNTIYIDNWYLGSTIYPSQVLADYGGDEQLSDFHGWDPLAVAIEEAHRVGLQVIVWFEYGLIGYYSYPDQQNPGPILENHPDWLMTTRDGQAYRIDTYGNYQYWMDPAHPAVVQFLKQLFEECARNYPNLDGIQTDRIRYPSTNYSFSDTSRSAYQRETGGSDPINITQNDPEWSDFVAWRERQTSNLADTLYKAVKSVNPELTVSSAVVPTYMLSGAQDKLQDWPTWIAEHSVDYVCPMLYGLQANFDYWLNQCLGVAPDPTRIFPGIDLDNLDNSTISSLITKSREHQMPGVVVWYWGFLNDQNMSYLGANDFNEPVPPSTKVVLIDNTDGYSTRSQGFTNATGGYGGYYDVSSETNAWFSWDVPVYADGNYLFQVYIPSDAIPEITQNYTVDINGEQNVYALDPAPDNSGWQTITNVNLSSNDDVSVTLSSSQSGQLIADAIRMNRLESLAIAESFASDSQHVKVKFNQPVTGPEVTNPNNYAVNNGVTIQAVQNLNDGHQIFKLTVSTLQPDTSYVLRAWGIQTQSGMLSDTVQTGFEYAGSASALVDNTDNLFVIQSGDWTMQTSQSNAVGGTYLTTPAGDGTHRVYWRYPVPQDGFYDVTAFCPDSSQFVTDAMYLLKTDSGFDTIRVNQQNPHPDGVFLGQVWADAGNNLVVKLHNESTNSPEHLVAADAVKFEKSFYTKITNNDLNIPQSITLLQNYPNPFNPQTTIKFTLPQKEHVLLRIYDLNGRAVKTVLNGTRDSGEYSVVVDMSQFPSGIYFYQLRTPIQVKTRKMTLLK